MDIFFLRYDKISTFFGLENSFMLIPEIFLFLTISLMYLINVFSNHKDFNNSVNKFCIISLFIVL